MLLSECLGNAEIIAEAVGWERTVGARAIFGARIPAPGAVEVTVIASPTALGVYTDAAPAARVRAIAAAMDAAGVPTVYSENIRAVQWAKVMYNCALNPLSALLDVPYGRLAEFSASKRMMDLVVEEVYAVAAARGIALEPDTAAAYLELFYGKMLPPTATHYASMREDLLQHRRTEIDALNGAVVRFGEACGVPCPVNATLSALIREREPER